MAEIGSLISLKQIAEFSSCRKIAYKWKPTFSLIRFPNASWPMKTNCFCEFIELFPDIFFYSLPCLLIRFYLMEYSGYVFLLTFSVEIPRVSNRTTFGQYLWKIYSHWCFYATCNMLLYVCDFSAQNVLMGAFSVYAQCIINLFIL